MDEIVKVIVTFIQDCLVFPSTFSLKKLIRRGEKEATTKGDLILPVQPLINFLPEEHQCKTLFDKMEYLEGLFSSLSEKSGFIKTIKVSSGMGRIFLDRTSIFSKFPELFKILESHTNNASFKNVNMNIYHHITEKNKSTITSLRAKVNLLHLKQLLIGMGVNVEIKTIEDNDIYFKNAETNLKSNSSCNTNISQRNAKDIENFFDFKMENKEKNNLSNIDDKITSLDINTGAYDSNFDLKREEKKIMLVVYEDSVKYLNIEDCNYNNCICITSGPVVNAKNGNKITDVSSDQYTKLLADEVIAASRHKIGKSQPEEIFNEYITSVKNGCTHLNLLSVAHQVPLKVSLEGEFSNTRDGAFILYNYARICTIFRNFEHMVEAEIIPPLPPIEQVDFTLLNHKEEWEIFWSFIHYWEDFQLNLQNEIKESILDNTLPKIKGTNVSSIILPIHKQVKFLHQLSHKLSIFYKYVRILPPQSNGKVLAHFLPKLWARLYLLKAVKMIMNKCFKYMEVIPLEIM